MNRESLLDGGLAVGRRFPSEASGLLRGGAAFRHPSPTLMSRARGWELGLPAYLDVGAFEQGLELPMIVAIGGGKGGVGKSLLAANFSARCAAAGLRVICFDLDVGGSNLHSYFGIGQPSATLADIAIFGSRSLDECLTPSGINGLSIVAGGKDECWALPNGLETQVLRRIAQQVLTARVQCKADLVVLDLGAGTARHTIDFFALAHLGLLTVLPEPTSIENAYLFLRTALLRLIANVGQRVGAGEAAAELSNQLVEWKSAENHGLGGSYVDRLRFLSSHYPGMVQQITEGIRSRLVSIAINQVRGQRDIDVGHSMEVIGGRYFGFPTRFCGWLPYDEAAWKSLRNQKLLVCDFPHSTLARRINELMHNVMGQLGC